MRVHILVALVAGLLLAANGQRKESAEELGQLTILEKTILEAFKKADASTLQALLRNDYVEVAGPNAERLTREEVVKALVPSRITDYALEDVRWVRLNQDAAILTYKLTLRGTPDDKGHFAQPASVASAWARGEMGWLSVFRDWTPLSTEAAGPPRVTAFEAALTPNSVRYLYKGTTKLEDIHATVEVTLTQGRVSTQDYWGSWDPGEVKEISLAFLASGVANIERLDLSAPATMGGKKVLCQAAAHRDARIPIDWKSVPPLLKLH